MPMEFKQICSVFLIVCGSLTWSLCIEHKQAQDLEESIVKRALQNDQKDGTIGNTSKENENNHLSKKKDYSWLEFTGRMIRKRRADTGIVNMEDYANRLFKQGSEIRYRNRRETTDDIAEEETDDDPNAGYGPWLRWGSCSVSCGRGRSERRRKCRDPIHCSSGDVEIRICGLKTCPSV